LIHPGYVVCDGFPCGRESVREFFSQAGGNIFDLTTELKRGGVGCRGVGVVLGGQALERLADRVGTGATTRDNEARVGFHQVFEQLPLREGLA
jgi:hypothetical protein